MNRDLRHRKVQLALSLGMAQAVLGLARREKRKREHEHAKNVRRGWKPEPGRYDRNLMHIEQMQDIIQQLEMQLGDKAWSPERSVILNVER